MSLKFVLNSFYSDFQANASIVHYLMDSSWNGNAKKCFAYCYEDDSDPPHCMCKPSLMEDQNYTLLAGENYYFHLKLIKE